MVCNSYLIRSVNRNAVRNRSVVNKKCKCVNVSSSNRILWRRKGNLYVCKAFFWNFICCVFFRNSKGQCNCKCANDQKYFFHTTFLFLLESLAIASGSFLIFSIALTKNARKIEIKKAANVTIMQSFPREGPDFWSGTSARSKTWNTGVSLDIVIFNASSCVFKLLYISSCAESSSFNIDVSRTIEEAA